MNWKRMAIGWVAAAVIPPLGAAQLIANGGKVFDGPAWLPVVGIAISSVTSATIYVIAQLNTSVGNPPLPAPAEAPKELPAGG